MTAGLHGGITNNTFDFNFKNNCSNDKDYTQHLQKYVWNQKGKWRKLLYILSSFVLLCSSISVILIFSMDKRQKKIHINMSKRIIDDVRFWDIAEKCLEHNIPSQSQFLADCHCLLFLVVASVKGWERLAHLTNRNGSEEIQITHLKHLIKGNFHITLLNTF